MGAIEVAAAVAEAIPAGSNDIFSDDEEASYGVMKATYPQ
jgi:hypothetical protein